MDTATIAASSGLTQMMQMQMQQRQPEPPLKDAVSGMSEKDKSTFDSNIESFSQDQMMYFMSLMTSNESEISEMSQEDASAAILELMDTVSSVEDLSEVEGLDALNKMPSSPPSGMSSPRQSGEAQDPLANLTEDNMSTFSEMIETMSDEQKLEFGSLLMDSKDELATLGAQESADKVLSLLEEASSTVTNSTTQQATQMFRKGGSFIDIYS